MARAESGDPEGARALLTELSAEGHAFDRGLVLSAIGQNEAALESLSRARFDGFDFAVTYWPTVATRYLFPTAWDRLRDHPRYDDLVRRIDRSWGLA